jgi:DNA-binding response OmpR family regulator
MTSIFWVEDQYHWIDKFKPILERAEFQHPENTEQATQSPLYREQKEPRNQLIIHKFIESACQAINHSKQAPDIAILDANMSGNDDAGLTISRLISKRWPNTPIIFLSEHSGTDVEERVFENSHSQDFIAKHQENIEKVLCWRIKALLRHKKIGQQKQKQSSVDHLVSGELVIDLTTWNVYWHGERLMNPLNQQRPLAPTPRKILRFLLESSPLPISTLQMEQKLEVDRFNYASYRQHIKTLRHSFEQACERNHLSSFLALNKSGKGIVTFGDDGAYCWVKP